MRENVFAMFHQGQPVSTMARVIRDLVIYGHTLRMGFIGGVCTHPDHRGKGLAGTVLHASLQRFVDLDVDFVYISGARALYYRTGANHIGGLLQFLLTADALKLIDSEDLTVRKATQNDVEVLHSLNESEETRLVHDLLDYELVARHGHCSGGTCTFNLIESGAKPVAYVAVRNLARKDDKWSQNVIEFAGDREAVLYALAKMANEHGPNGSIIVEMPPGEQLASRLCSLGVENKPSRMGGTVKMVNFTGTMEKLRPYFGSQLGSSFAESLEFSTGIERYVISGEGGALEIDGESNMLWTLFSAPPGKESENVRASGVMKKALEVCLPIPIPALGINKI